MRSLRLLAPVGVAGAIALGAWVPTITAAGATTPDLPAISATQLLAKVQQAHVAGYSGTVRWSAELGLPDISGLTSSAGQSSDHGGFDPTSLLSGSHDISVWVAGPEDQRFALPATLQETDLIHNGRDLWFYDSSTQVVTHYVAAAGHHRSQMAEPATPDLTPNQVAARVLASLDPSTTVTVASPVTVAGRPTYELVLAPKSTTSTVGRVTIAVDAATGLPLQVQVVAVGGTAPTLSLGFTSIHLSVPASSNFAAPTGSSTVTKTLGDSKMSGEHDRTRTGGGGTVSGSGWGSVVTLHDANLGRAGHQLDQVSTTVTGSFGTARLVHTNLLNALVLPDGRILAGFVTPTALEAAATSGG